MKTAKDSEQQFRGGDWGPKYLMRGPHCEWGIIVLKPGQALGRHGHRTVVEDFYILDGTPLITVAGSRLRLQPGDVVRAEPGEEHDILNDSSATVRLVFIKAPFLPDDKVSSAAAV